MKIYLEERIKHRIIGIIVLFSIAIVFLPAVMKQSNYRFDKKTQIAVKLPEKPATPRVAEPDKKAMFKEVKVATVNLQKVKEGPQLKDVNATLVAHAKGNNTNTLVAHSQIPGILSTDNNKIQHKAASINKKANLPKKQKYNVHLASFKVEKNAENLVTKLRSQGYMATYGKYTGKNGQVYTVMVTKLDREDAELIRNQLAVSMRLDGLIIRTG